MTPTEYEQTVTRLTTDPVITRIVQVMPSCLCTGALLNPDTETQDGLARKLNLLYWIGVRQQGRQPANLPFTAVTEAVRRAAQKAGRAA